MSKLRKLRYRDKPHCSRNIDTLTSLSLLTFCLVLLFFPMNPVHSAVISLETADCYTRKGFSITETKIQPVISGAYKKVKSFPILLNQIHEIPESFSLNTFSIFCDVFLEQDTADAPNYALYLPGIGEGFEIYFNGEKVLSRLYIENDRLKNFYYTKFLKVPLPGKRIKSQNRLFFHIAGYAPISALSRNFLLGLPFRSGYIISPESESTGTSNFLLFFLNASYILLGFFHLYIFLRWSVVRYNLYFGLFTLCISGYFLAFSQPAFETFHDSKYLVMLSYMCQPMALAWFTLFLQAYFYPGMRLSILPRFLPWMNFIFVLAITPGKEEFFQPTLMIWYILAGAHVLYLFAFLKKIFLEKLKDSRVLIFSVAGALLMILFDILDTIFFFTNMRLGQLAYFLIIMSLAWILVSRFVGTMLEARRRSGERIPEHGSFWYLLQKLVLALSELKKKFLQAPEHKSEEYAILFADIHNFSRLSQDIPAGKIFRLLNIFTRRMEICIKRRYGFIDKYIGDGILAVFENNISQTGYHGAVFAVKCAVDMLQNVHDLNEQKSAGNGKIQIGIGIHAGKNFTTADKFNEAKAGTREETIKITAWLEQITLRYGAPLIITGQVKEYIQRSDLHTRELDIINLKNQGTVLTLHEVFDADSPDCFEKKLTAKMHFARALELYRSGEFSSARSIFEKIHGENPEDFPAKHMARRCSKLHKSRLVKNWSAILVHKNP